MRFAVKFSFALSLRIIELRDILAGAALGFKTCN